MDPIERIAGNILTRPDNERWIVIAAVGDAVGDVEALEGVRKFPVRVKCALLAWTTLEEALATVAEQSHPAGD